ncbi:MAG: type II toxin-antitoxin system RelE/ParE family toxin [Chloroflexota bacterium]
MPVRWLRRALRNLEDVYDFIAEDNHAAASAAVARLYEAASQLDSFLALGRPGRVVGTRELVVPGTPYIIPYRVRDREVEVLAVLHTSRRWPSRL